MREKRVSIFLKRGVDSIIVWLKNQESGYYGLQRHTNLSISELKTYKFDHF